MAGEINRGGLSDSLSYLFIGDGTTETFEPFCEASLLEPYPHSSLKEAREMLRTAGRVQLVAQRARHSTWIIDQVIRVTGWSNEIVSANSAIWSKRLAVANIAYVTSSITAIGASLYALVGTDIGVVVTRSFGDAMAQQTASAAFATLGWSHVALVALIVGSAALWYLSSRRYSLAEMKLSETEKTAAQNVAEFRDRALLVDFYSAIARRATPGRVTSDCFVAPQETQWLWVERICQESSKFENPTMATGAELTLEFTRINPFDVMDRALEGSPIATALLGAKASYQPLAAQLRQVQKLYDMRAGDIRHLAKKNRELIRERRRAAFNVVDGIYWSRVDAARNERDRALRPYQCTISNLSLDEAREAERRYNSDSRVIAIKSSYQNKVRDYGSYRDLSHAAIRGWFNPQIKKEYEKEEADLRANHETNLSHIGRYYPSVRALYGWTVRSLEVPQSAGLAPALTEVVAPSLPTLQTQTQPAEPSSSEMRAWADAGSGLGLDLFLTCAAAGVGFYAAYKASSSNYEQVIADHRDEESASSRYDEPPPPHPFTPEFYAPEPSAPPLERLPTYEEAMSHPEPSAPPLYTPLNMPPTYGEAMGHPQPSAPPLPPEYTY